MWVPEWPWVAPCRQPGSTSAVTASPSTNSPDSTVTRCAHRVLAIFCTSAKKDLGVAELLDVLPTARVLDADLARWVDERIAARAQARKSKDFKAADAIRGELAERGIEIEDTPHGTKWRMA